MLNLFLKSSPNLIRWIFIVQSIVFPYLFFLEEGREEKRRERGDKKRRERQQEKKKERVAETEQKQRESGIAEKRQDWNCREKSESKEKSC